MGDNIGGVKENGWVGVGRGNIGERMEVEEREGSVRKWWRKLSGDCTGGREERRGEEEGGRR